MAQTTTKLSFNVNDTVSDPGEPLPIPADDFSSLSVTNNSGKTMSYSTDGGATWSDLAAGASLLYEYGLKSKYLFRKADAGWATLEVTVTYPGTAPANLRMVSGNVTGLVGPGVEIPLNSVEAYGASPSATASANATALQRALDAGGLVKATKPGTYLIGDGPSSASTHSIVFKSDTELYLGAGVVLKQAIGGKSFGVNEHWKSAKFQVNAIISFTLVTTKTYDLVLETVEAAHGLVAGDYFIVKGDVENKRVNDAWAVHATPAANRITVRIPAVDGLYAPYTFTTKPILYQCDRSIKFSGSGKIDCDYRGGSGLLSMGMIFNKIDQLRFEISVQNAMKYGVLFCNAHNSTFVDTDVKAPSASVQGLGPLKNITFLDQYGGRAADDIWAVTSNNAGGYTAYDLYDADGTTKNSDGDLEGIFFRNNHPSFLGSRHITVGAADGFKAKKIRVSGLSSKDGGMILFENLGTGALSATFDDIRITDISAERSTTTSVVLFTSSPGATSALGSLVVSGVKVSVPAGAAGSNHSVVDLEDAIATSNYILVNDVEIVKSAATTSRAIITVTNGTHELINLTNYRIHGDASSTSTTYGLLALGAISYKAVLRGGVTSGANVVHANSASSQTWPSVDLTLTDFYSPSGVYAVAASGSGHFTLSNGIGTDVMLLNGTSKSYVINVSNIRVNGSFIYGLGASSIAYLSGSGVKGVLAHAASMGSGAKVVLEGAAFSSGQLDGTKLDTTFANHSKGAMFYNTNAAFGAGVGVYNAGPTAWALMNPRRGTAVLSAGAATVANTSVTANSQILLTSQIDGGTPGFLRVSARTAGTGFTITSSSGTDTSTVAYEINEPN